MKKKYEEIEIVSDLENLILVQNFVEEITDRFNIPNHFGILAMALEQAATNAIVHGNKSSKKKKVTLRCAKCNGGLYFSITDEGKGFDYTLYNDFSETGNGIFLMRSLCDQLEFLNKGKTIKLTFFIEGIESSKALERAATMKNFFAVQQQQAVSQLKG